MNVIAITGASGYIGKNLVAELTRIGDYEVRVLSRNKRQDLIEKKFDSTVEIIEGDLNDPASLQSLLKPGCTVINLVYLWGVGEVANLQVINHLLDACSLVGVNRLIHCSTAAVVGRVQENQITESTPCRPITEYGITKLKIEKIIVDKSRGYFDVVILRPTSVFGIDGEPLKKLADDLAHGSHWQNYVKSCLFRSRRMNLVHIANVVAAIIFLIHRTGNLDGETFIVSDDDSPVNNFAYVERFLMNALNIPDYSLPRLPAPSALLKLLLTCLGRNNINPHCNYSPDKLLGLGFERPINFEAGLTEYAKWYRYSYIEGQKRVAT